jgi:electron transfer flavoprotein alpha subunit
MSILVFAEQREKTIRKAAIQAVSKGRALAEALGEKVTVLLIGSGISDLVDEIKKYGPHEIYVADSPELALYQTETYARVLEETVKKINPSLVLMAHSVMAKDLAPRVAQRVGAGLLTDCVDIRLNDEDISFVRPIYAGKALARMKITTAVQFVTLRANVFPAEVASHETEVRELDVATEIPRARTLELDIPPDQGPELTEADIIVSGGRGLGDEEGFALVEKLAKFFGAAVGASRSAVDAGWKSHQHQVGQTGKVVSPKLYVALGISGAIQHIAGMGTSKCIVAVNKDPEANIFKVADYGIVGDLYEVVPIIIDHIEKKGNLEAA